MSDALLQRGTQLSHYRVGSIPGEPGLQLVFQAAVGGDWWLLGSVPNRHDGMLLAHAVQSLLVSISRRCEGMHLVEHLLLRPLAGNATESHGAITGDPEFLAGRLTIVFPSWTRRCQDPSFRLLAEQLVRENCPAHLLPDILWLDFYEMYRFEGLYIPWLKAKRERPEGSAELDEISSELALFLASRGGSIPGREGTRSYV